MTVAGVVGDAKVEWLDEAPSPLVYQALAQHPHWMLDDIRVVARTTDEPRHMLPALSRTLVDVRPDVPVFGAATFGDAMDDVVVAQQRLGAMLLGAFSLLALVAPAAGIYGWWRSS